MSVPISIAAIVNFPSGWLVLLAAFVAAIFLLFVIMALSRFKRCPSNRILVIYGKVGSGNTARCVHGGAAFVLPLIQDYSFLNLEPLQIEIPLAGALSIENIRVNVPSVFTVAIGTQPELMQNAAIRLLGLDMKRIQERVEHIIFGQLREVVASMRIEDITRHREQFLKNIQLSLEPELNKLGLVLLNVNITDITDESGYIVAIGKKAASQAVQQALVDVSQQEKLGAGGVADAERERAIQVANAQKLKEIGLHEAQKDQAVRIAELERDQKLGEQQTLRDQAVRMAELNKEQKIAEQAASFERDSKIKEAEQVMRISVAEANAKAIAGESLAQGDVALAQSQLQVKQAEAFRLSETKKREADAAVQEAQNLAMAKAALANAQRVEAERRAAVEAPAKAEKARILVEAQAAAEKRRMEAEAEANALFVRLEAEAKGQYEILAKKAEGLKQIIESCGSADKAFQMLMLEHMDKLAETAATAISNIKFDKVVVWEGGRNGENGTASANFLQGMARSMPPMLQVLRDIGGVELPAFLGRSSDSPRPAGHDSHAATGGNGSHVVTEAAEPVAVKPSDAEPSAPVT